MPEKFEPHTITDPDARYRRYEEALEYVSDNLSQAEKMSLICDLLANMEQDILIPCRGWGLTEQGGARDVLTINLRGSVPNKHAAGTVSFVETDMPRSKMQRTLIPDMAPRQLPEMENVLW